MISESLEPHFKSHDGVVDATWRMFLTFLSFLLGILAIVTNGTIIGVFLYRRHVLRPMHCYLFSDCVTNILAGIELLIIGFLLSTDNLTPCSTQFLLEGMLIVILVTGFLSILTIAIERYRAIVQLLNPLNGAQRRAIILAIWSTAIILLSTRYVNTDTLPLENVTTVSGLPIYHDCKWNETISDTCNITKCSIICFVTPTFDKIATTILFVVFYILPTIASVFLYSRVVKQLWKRRQMGSVVYQEKKRQAINAMVYILATFVMCWFPFFVYRFTSLWMKYNTMTCGYNAFLISTYILGCSESTVSALIYISYSQDFRNAVCDITKLLRPKQSSIVPSPIYISCSRLNENCVK